MDGFEVISDKESWNRYGWGCELKEGSNVMLGVFEVYIGELADDECGRYTCEIFASDGDMVGQWVAATPEEALEGAVKHKVW